MMTGTSACSCIRNVQRSRSLSRNEFLSSPRQRSSQHGPGPRLRREMHATPINGALSIPRRSHNPLELNIFSAGQKNTSSPGWRLPTGIRYLSTKVGGARRKFNPPGSRSSGVVKKYKQQDPDTLKVEQTSLHQSAGLLSQVTAQPLTTSEKRDINTMKQLSQSKLRISLDFMSGPRRSNVCQLTCCIPETEEKIETMKMGIGKLDAELSARLHMISKLKESGAWGKLLQGDAMLNPELHEAREAAHEFLCSLCEQNRLIIDMVATDNRPSQEFTCRLACNIPSRKEQVNVTAMTRSSSSDAQRQAFLLLIPKLQEIGVWREWVRRDSKEDAFADALEASLRPNLLDSSECPLSQSSQISSTTLKTGKEMLRQAEKKGRCVLDIDHTGNSSGPGILCSLRFWIPRSNQHITVSVWGSDAEKAGKKAFQLLVSELQESGMLGKLVDHALLAIDDDLLEVMDYARVDLRRAKGKEWAKTEIPGHQPQPKQWTDDLKNRPEDQRERSTQLHKSLAKINESQNPYAVALRASKAQLPVIERKQEILNLVNCHTYSIVVADTGSGKSTQVPQIILDDAIERDHGPQCRVLCVQPRRIAAQMLAQRVAKERSERVGDTVGCIVRLDHRVSPQGGTITYCTTGVMLLMLQNASHLFESYTHIMLDEVHVRDVGIDFVMLLLKHHIDGLQAKGIPTPKVIVSSATMDIDLFSSYFRNKTRSKRRNKKQKRTLVPASYTRIPGRQFEVKTHYLDELLESMIESLPPNTLASYLDEKETAKFLDEHYARFDPQKPAQDKSQEVSNEKETNIAFPRVTQIAPSDDPRIPFGLICATIFHLLLTTETGSILVFLPRLGDILAVEQQLKDFAPPSGVDLSNDDRVRVLKLHSQLPDELDKLSLDVPSGCRRILLSTDVAEASLTLPDVKYVVDTGRVNQLNFESGSFSNRLTPHWVSQASTTQRAGRAGRVQEGEYFFLGTKQRFDTLRITNAPEMQRVDLQIACLRARQAAPQIPISRFFKSAIEPPDEEKLQATIGFLKQLKALDEHENLTALGSIIVDLPVNPAFGKLIVLGIIFNCLDPMLILALLADSELFYRPMSRSMARQIRSHRAIFDESQSSDHVSTVNAFKAVRKVWNEKGRQAAHDFAVAHSIYFPVYRETSVLGLRIFTTLKQRRLLPHGTPLFDDEGQIGGARYNANSNDGHLIKALLLHCLFPRVSAPGMTLQPTMSTKADSRASTGSLSLVNGIPKLRELAMFNNKFMMSHSPARLIEVTLVTPLMACLFSGSSGLSWTRERMLVDSWLTIGLDVAQTSSPEGAVSWKLRQLSQEIDKALDTIYALRGHDLRGYSEDQRLAFFNDRNTLENALRQSVQNVLMRDRHHFRRLDSRAVEAPVNNDLDGEHHAIHA